MAVDTQLPQVFKWVEFFEKLTIQASMEISIRNVSETSAVSGKALSPGDRVWSILFRDAEGVIERMDVLPGELEQTGIEEGDVLCRWSQLLKEKETTEAEARRAALQSTEEVFLSLYEADEDSGDDAEQLKETRDRLKFFLAIQLERKRILKPVGKQVFRHMATKRIYEVPKLELTPELALQFQTEMAQMGPGL